MSIQGKNTENFHVEDYLEAVLDNFHDGIYITDCEANTVYLNHSYELISGLRKSEMIGKNMKDLVEAGVISMSGTLAVLEGGEPVTSEQIFRTGKRAVITSTPVFDGEDHTNLVMVVTLVREITEIYSIRKELQRKEQQNRQYMQELERMRRELDGDVELVAVAEASSKLLKFAEKMAMVDMPVLLWGEKGSGKCRMAKYIHAHSNRSEAAFLRLDFSAVPKDDLETYLFGKPGNAEHESQIGLLESADGGTLYIEELADTPGDIQGDLLSLLRDGCCIMKEGYQQKLNIRMIAGSRYAIPQLEKMSNINRQLLQHFSLFSVEVPPLRERREDIIPLIEFFLNQYNHKTGQNKHFDRESYQCLSDYPWPGNVQELRNLVQRSAIVSAGEVIRVQDLFLHDQVEKVEQYKETNVYPDQTDLKMEVAKFEAGYLEHAFQRYGNIREAAASLGMDSSTFVRKRQKYEQLGLMKSEKRK